MGNNTSVISLGVSQRGYEMANYKLDLVTAPALEPVTVTELKTALRIDSTDDDTLLGYLITAARTNAEIYTRRAFITQTWKMFMDSFSGYPLDSQWWSGVRYGPITDIGAGNYIDIPLPPLQSITHLKTYDDADAATTFASSSYYVSTYSGIMARVGTITLRDSAVWPTYERNKDGIEIQFVAGYGDAASDVPQQIRIAIQEEASFLYQNRSSCDGDALNSGIAKQMLKPFRILKL